MSSPDSKATESAQKRPLTRPLELTSLKLAYEKVAKRLRIFLAGPYISKEHDEGKEPESKAAKLRRDLLAHLEQKNDVSLGEHRGVVELTSEIAGGLAHAALSELAIIKKEIDAVIIIPASAGSFCELGAWSQSKNIAEKMLVLCDQDHRDQPSYLATGVVTLATYHGSEVEWISYDDLEAAKALVDSFLQKRTGAILTKELLSDT